MKKIVILGALAILLLVICVFSVDSVFADTQAPVYHVSISQDGKISTTHVGYISYTNVSNQHYKLDSSSTSQTGFNYYLNTYSCSEFDVYNTDSNSMKKTMSNGYCIVPLAGGQISYIYIYNTYYEIDYVLNGGTQNQQNPEAFYANSNAFSLHEPSRQGYIFAGWYKSSDYSGNQIYEITPSNEIKNITLYAKWFELNSLNVYARTTDCYNLIDTVIDSCNYYFNDVLNHYIYDKNILNLNTTHQKDYLKVYNIEDNEITISTSNGKYFSPSAYGKPKQIIISNSYYSINYVLNGGSFDEPSISYYENTNQLAQSVLNPKKTGYRFNGWYLDPDFAELFDPLSNFELRDITLYASFSEEFSIPVIRTYTNLYEELTETVDSVIVYLAPATSQYIYSNNFEDKKNEYNCQLKVYNIEDNEITISTSNGKYFSPSAYGKPKQIIISNSYYSINYVLNGGTFDEPSINYYENTSQLDEHLLIPKKENSVFLGWALNEDLSESYNDSSFTARNIDLFPIWSEKQFIKVMYYNDSLNDGVYESVGQTYYYKQLENFYCYGSFDNTTDQLGYFLNKYNTTSFEVLDVDNNLLNCTTSNGKLLSIITDTTPTIIRIYRNYTIKFYVNGTCVGLDSGKPGDAIKTPDFILGFIGKNYEAIDIGSLTIGNRYAIYLFDGWSFEDTSDKTWFDKTQVDYINDWKYSEDKIYVKKVFAYMKFYSKLSENNNEIDYDKYIEETKGIITTSSPYSIDELLLEHATKISSDTQLTVSDKIARALNLDKTNPLVTFLDTFISNKSTSFSELWNNSVGKILIISFGLFGILSIIFVLSCLKSKFNNINKL